MGGGFVAALAAMALGSAAAIFAIKIAAVSGFAVHHYRTYAVALIPRPLMEKGSKTTLKPLSMRERGFGVRAIRLSA
jgi:hypothetical protein